MTRAARPAGCATLGAGALCALLGSLSVFAWGACDAIRPRPKDQGRCDPDHPCAEGKVCIPYKLGGSRGRCATECKDDQACGQGARCTGRYQKLGSLERFCRRSEGALGASCAAPLSGCRPGLGCFQGTCRKECKKDEDCPELAHRCLPVTVDTMVNQDRVEVFSACLPAVVAEGNPCKPEGPFCGRGLLCHNEKCTRSCAKDADCPKDHVCDGALYHGKDREARAKQRQPPDLRYCRQGAKKGRPCHHNLDVGCAAGLACIKFQCREVRNVGLGKRCDPEKGSFCEAGLLCHANACRKPCLEDKDCAEAADGGDGAADVPAAEPAEPPRRGRRRVRRRAPQRRARPAAAPRCREVLIRNQTLRVCL